MGKKKRSESQVLYELIHFQRIQSTQLGFLLSPSLQNTHPFHSIPFHFFLSIFPRFGHARKNKRRKGKNHKGTRENKSRSLAPSSPPLSLKAASSCHHPLDPPPPPKAGPIGRFTSDLTFGPRENSWKKHLFPGEHFSMGAGRRRRRRRRSGGVRNTASLRELGRRATMGLRERDEKPPKGDLEKTFPPF